MNSPLEQPQSAAEIRTEMRVEVRGYLVLVTLVSLVIGGLIGYFTPRSSEQPVSTQLEPPPGWGAACVEVAVAGTPAPIATPKPLRVYLSGAVREPQVVVLPADSLLADALAAAGGPLPTANMETLNLAAPLVDHQHIIIPTTAAAPPAATPREGTAAKTPTTSTRLNINTATAAELETLPGIGQSRAMDIIAYREAEGDFQQIEDIQYVSGIGESIFAKLAPLITVSE